MNENVRCTSVVVRGATASHDSRLSCLKWAQDLHKPSVFAPDRLLFLHLKTSNLYYTHRTD